MVIERRDVPVRPTGSPPEQEGVLLITDVAALTGVPPPQLRSWEQAGLLHPRRAPNAVRVYGIEDVAWARLIKRSLVNPGRRGSLRRLAAQIASGSLQPVPADYAGLAALTAGPASLAVTQHWRAMVDAMEDLVVVCDTGGHMTYANPALQVLLPEAATLPVPVVGDEPAGGVALPPALETLPLRWVARTGTQHHDVPVMLRAPNGIERRTLWTVTPLRTANGAVAGAVGVGRAVRTAPATTPENWLAMATHDLRSPVTNILGRLQLARRATASLRDGLAPPRERAIADELDRHLALAEVSTIDLIHMMETLLTTTAVADGTVTQYLEPDEVTLDLLARQAVEHAQQHTSRHLITLAALSMPLVVAGDRMRLRQVLDNLLENAVKYAPDGGTIAVRLEAVTTPPALPQEPPQDVPAGTGDIPHWVVVRVEDAGLGIAAADVPYVFDRYWRAGGVARHFPGHGLGLSICRAIVAAHGGHIWVEHTEQATHGENEAGGGWHGTVMALILPLAAPPGPFSMAAG
jgi:signal transduction histidine kinase